MLAFSFFEIDPRMLALKAFPFHSLDQCTKTVGSTCKTGYAAGVVCSDETTTTTTTTLFTNTTTTTKITTPMANATSS